MNYQLLFYLSCNILILVCSKRITPEIIDKSRDIIANIGDEININCTIKNVADKTVSWTKYSTEFESDTPGSSVVLAMRNMLSLSGSRYSIILEKLADDVIMYGLKITNSEASDMGLYECQVIVSVSEKITRQVNVAIKHPPQISERRTPKSTIVTEGQNLEITCRAMGFPQPTIYWTREDDEIMPAGGQNTAGPTLKVKEVHRLDRGNYYCNADNGVGTPAKRLVRVEVEFRPQIATRIPKVAQMPSYPVELECNVQAYPAPAVFWHRNGNQLTSDHYYKISNTASAHELTTSVLRIFRVSSSDYGDYYCNATNKLGQAEARLHLFKPVIPVPYY